MSRLHDFKNQVRALFGFPRRRRLLPLPLDMAGKLSEALGDTVTLDRVTGIDVYAEPEPVQPGRYPIAQGVTLKVYRESLTGVMGRRVELDEYQGA